MIIDVSGADLLLADIRVRAGQAAGDRVQHHAGRVLVRMFRCYAGNRITYHRRWALITMTTVGYGDMSSVSSPLPSIAIQYTGDTLMVLWVDSSTDKNMGKTAEIGKNTDNALHAP